MNSSIGYQIELVEKLINDLNFFSSQVEENIKRYQKYITLLESNGLAEEMVSNMQDKYFVNSKGRLTNLIEQIQNKDIPDAKKIIENLEELKNRMQE